MEIPRNAGHRSPGAPARPAYPASARRRALSPRAAACAGLLGALVSCALVSCALLAGCDRDPLGELPAPGPQVGRWQAVPSSEGPWNLLLITLDTTRRDRLGCYGYAQATSPNIDSLAARGVLFEQPIAPTPVTLPSHATILTGLDPTEHGARNNGTFVLEERFTTLAERLSEKGYETGAILGAFPVDERFGLAQGFDLYDDDFPAASQTREWQSAQRRAGDVTRLTLEWLGRQRRDPFFCWAHYYDPHFPYEAPEPFRGAFAHPYDGEVAYVDAEIGRLARGLRDLGLEDRTWIMLVGDHGESLGEHGELGHSMLIYGATQYVPCILVPPADWHAIADSRLRGRRLAPPVRLKDLAPTMINALGFEESDGLGSGVSLLPLVAGRDGGPRIAYTETLVPMLECGWSDLRGVRVGGWSYIRAPEPELYDLRRDPQETKNLHAAHPRIVERLAAWCDYFTAAEGELSVAPLSAETAERLRSLGYIASAAPRAAGAADKDPKKLIADFNRINDARTALGVHRAREAETMMREVLERDERNPTALQLYGTALLRQGKGGEALAAFRRLREECPDDLEVRLNEIRAQIMSGALAEAERELLAMVTAVPEHASARSLYAMVLTQGGRAAEAERFLTALRSRFPDDGALLLELAQVAHAAQDRSRAERLAVEVLERDSTAAGAWAIRGECVWGRAERAAEADRGAEGERLGTEARVLLERALALDPMQPIAGFRLAWLERQAGRVPRAIELYQRVLVREPQLIEAHVNLANLFREENRLDEALRHYEIAFALGHEDVNFLVNYGVALAMRGRNREALMTWERAFERAPDERYKAGIRRNIEMLRRGQGPGGQGPGGQAPGM